MLHLDIIVQRLLILTRIIGLYTLTKHAGALPHLDAIDRLQTLESVKFRLDGMNIIVLIHHSERIEQTRHCDVPFLGLNSLIKGHLCIFKYFGRERVVTK